jgi:hypothetical protein
MERAPWVLGGSLVHDSVFWDLTHRNGQMKLLASFGFGHLHQARGRTNVSNEKIERLNFHGDPLRAEALTPRDVEAIYLIPTSSQKKARAKGTFVPYYRVGRRIYYLRSSIEAWLAEQQQATGSNADSDLDR